MVSLQIQPRKKQEQQIDELLSRLQCSQGKGKGTAVSDQPYLAHQMARAFSKTGPIG